MKICRKKWKEIISLPTFERRLAGCCNLFCFVCDLTARPQIQIQNTHTHSPSHTHMCDVLSVCVCLFHFIIFSLLWSTSWLTTFKYSPPMARPLFIWFHFFFQPHHAPFGQTPLALKWLPRLQQNAHKLLKLSLDLFLIFGDFLWKVFSS